MRYSSRFSHIGIRQYRSHETQSLQMKLSLVRFDYFSNPMVCGHESMRKGQASMQPELQITAGLDITRMRLKWNKVVSILSRAVLKAAQWQRGLQLKRCNSKWLCCRNGCCRAEQMNELWFKKKIIRLPILYVILMNANININLFIYLIYAWWKTSVVNSLKSEGCRESFTVAVARRSSVLRPHQRHLLT